LTRIKFTKIANRISDPVKRSASSGSELLINPSLLGAARFALPCDYRMFPWERRRLAGME